MLVEAGLRMGANDGFEDSRVDAVEEDSRVDAVEDRTDGDDDDDEYLYRTEDENSTDSTDDSDVSSDGDGGEQGGGGDKGPDDDPSCFGFGNLTFDDLNKLMGEQQQAARNDPDL
jgi:hypothetical protein